MATAAHSILGYTGTLGRTISARRRGEPKYSKQQQARMIRAILSRRMMSPPSYEDVLDYVDSNVTYAENKKEVLAVFGERSRRAQITTKDLDEMRCTSLHNKCASNGLDSCQVACDECSNPAACKKADKIEKEIKKHCRELTGFERMQTAHEKEAKRAPKKAKYSTGQTVKCREGYELQCGFSGSQKITQVKQYPDYVMYGIRGKAQGFVEEDWIVGVKPIPTLKKKKVVRYAKKLHETSKEDTRKVVVTGICPVCGRKLPEALTHTWEDYATLEVHCSHCKTRFFCDTGTEGAGWSCDITKPSKEIRKPVKPAKPLKKKSVYVMFKGVKKHRMRCPICGRAAIDNFCIVHSDVKALDLETSKKAQKLTAGLLKTQKKWEAEHPERAKAQKKAEAALKTRLEPRAATTKPAAKRAAKPLKPHLFGIKTLAEAKRTIAKMKKAGKLLHPADEGIFKTGYGKQCQKCGYVVKSWNEWKRIHKLAPYKETFPRTGFKIVEIHPCPKCHSDGLSGDWGMLKQKPPKPKPAKITKPKKKTTRKQPSKGVKKVKIKLKKPTGITLHSKTLTDAQIKHAHKYGYVNVTIDGVKKRVTKRNFAPRKRTVQWYKSGGNVCLKAVRR